MSHLDFDGSDDTDFINIEKTVLDNVLQQDDTVGGIDSTGSGTDSIRYRRGGIKKKQKIGGESSRWKTELLGSGGTKEKSEMVRLEDIKTVVAHRNTNSSIYDKSTTAPSTTTNNEDGIPDLTWNLYDPLEGGVQDSGIDLDEGRFDTNWYDQDEFSHGGGGMKDNHAYDDDYMGYESREKRMTDRMNQMISKRGNRMSQMAQQRHKQQELWEMNRIQVAGVGGRRKLDMSMIDDGNQESVHVVVHNVKPAFFGDDASLNKGKMVSVFRDETSDLCVLAKKGSNVVKHMREQEDRNAMRERFWDLQGSNMGALLGIKGDMKYMGIEEEDEPTMALGEALKMQDQAVDHEAQRLKIKRQRESLPIFNVKEDFLTMFREHPIVVVIGETGSGKTTQIVQYLHEEGYTKFGMVGCSQPRRVAAVSVAKRVAEEMNTPLGDGVGYAIRFEDCSGPNTKIKYMTDGVLLRETLNDRDLDKYSCLIMDEAHERTLNTDVLFGVLKDVVARRRDFKLIVTSATLDSEKFSGFFGDAPVYQIPGRTFPVQIEYLRSPCADYVETAVQKALQIHCNGRLTGDILIFMTGREDIEMTCLMIAERLKDLGEKAPDARILPIYSNLPPEMQALIFAPIAERKIIVATNIAETSLTLDGVRYVIDSGYHKLKVYNPQIGLDSLLVCPVSQAAARQRSGRAGRTAPGVCHRLYTERAMLAELYETSIPEIQRTNLSNVVLLLKSLNIDVMIFDFMDPPPKETLLNAMYELWVLGALDDIGELTDIGTQMVSYPLEPSLSKIMLSSINFRCIAEMLVIVALLSVPPIFFRPRDRQEEADAAREKFFVPESDHLTLLNVYKMWVKHGHSPVWCAAHFLHHKVLKKAQEIHLQLKEILSNQRRDTHISSGANQDLVRQAICSGYFHHAAKMRGIGEYLNLRSAVTSYLHPTSALYASGSTYEYIVYHEVMVTTKEYLQHATAVEPEWLAQQGPMFFDLRYTGIGVRAQSSDITSTGSLRRPERRLK